MHPALSVIAFTTLSGAGYGLLVWLGLAVLAGEPLGARLAVALGASALTLVTVGLLCSLGHLGKPTRAWRALSQWRTSWLSREGVAAIATYVPALVVVERLVAGRHDAVGVIASAALVVLAFVTVYCTARIYSSLKTVRAWHNGWTVPGYVLQSLWCGTALAWMLLAALHGSTPPLVHAAFALLTVSVAAHALGYRRWRASAGAPGTTGAATGLDRFGAVRSFEQPHTEENYLLREMGFVLARKHATRLGRVLPGAVGAALVALALDFVAPAWAWGALAAGIVLAGTFVERWLFFAQARHVVTLYYGGEAADQSPSSSRPAPLTRS